MTDVSRLRQLRFGKHSAATAFTSADSGSITYAQIRPLDDSSSFLPRARNAIDRNLRSSTGQRYAHIHGLQDLSDLQVSTEVKGINAISGGAIANWEAKQTELGVAFECFFGAIAPATSGSAVTITAGAHSPSTGVVIVSGAGSHTVGGVVAFMTSSGLQMGTILSVVTTTLTLEHPYNGTPVTGETIYRCAKYAVSDTTTHHTHGSFVAEGENWRRDYFGCVPKSFSIETGGGALVMNQVWAPSSFVDTAEANTAHAEPTAGSPIVMDACNIWFAGAALIARDVSITYDNAVVMRKADTATNGVLGGVCSASGPKTFKCEFTVYLGAVSLSEIQDSTGTPTLNSLLGDSDSAGDVSTTRELSVQIGTELGAAMYLYMGAADTQVKTMDQDGLTAVRVTCVGTGTTPGHIGLC